jgi:hypothetical protein
VNIATRKPKRKFKIGVFVRKVVLPVAALGALAGALVWPPSHRIIFEGPLKPTIDRVSPYVEQFGRPLTFVAQQQTIREKNREIQALDRQLEDVRKQLAGRDDQIKALQAQLNEARNRAASIQTPASPIPAATANPGGNAPVGGQVALGAGSGSNGPAVSPDVKRTAAVWAQMDPESVAALAQKLPIEYVVRVMGQMSPDQVGQVLEALPPAVAAKIVRTRPGE